MGGNAEPDRTEDAPPAPTSVGVVGNRLGAYRVLSCLGSGAMGSVYLAEVERPAWGLAVGTRVALKVVHQHLRSHAELTVRFHREAEIGRQLVHENVVRTHGVESIEQDRTSFDAIVMEYVEGRTLRERLQAMGRVPEALCLHVAHEVALGLGAIHDAGAVHRDVKPENVLITKDDVVKVMDLGVAHLVDAAARLTQPGWFVGTELYAAPEQLDGREDEQNLDGRTDLYALGLILYELSTGAHPFAADDNDRYEHRRRVLQEVPKPVSDLNPQLSPFFEEVVRTLLEKDRNRRFARASELADVILQGERSLWWRRRATEIRARTHRPLRRIRVPRTTALYGREQESSRLRAIYERVRKGEGQMVLVEGEAGVGKTRFVDEFVEGLRSSGENVHFLFGSYPPGGAATATSAFMTAFREHFGEEDLENALAPHLGTTPLLLPAFAALLRGGAIPKGVEPLTKDSLQTVFVRATRSLASEYATIVLIDDLHFAPEEGRALFAALAHAISGDRVLLVGTSRPGLPTTWIADLERIGLSTRIALARLGPKDLARLLVDVLGSERLAAELGFQIGAKSDGNPFFVFEILQDLLDGGQLARGEGGTWSRRAEIRDIRIPSTVVDLIEARLGALDAKDRELLEVAACYGFEFDPLLVGEVTKLGPVPALQRLAGVEKATRLVRSVGRRYVFDHHQVQEALYRGLPEPLRAAYHAAIAEALEAHAAADLAADGEAAVRLCDQFFRGDRGPRAVFYLGPALDHLEKRQRVLPEQRDESTYDNERALALANRALAVRGLLTGWARVGLLLRKAARLDLLGRAPDERQALDEALAIADSEERPPSPPPALVSLSTTRSVVISYAAADRTVATAACRALEARGIRCWIAPRDVPDGASVAGAALEAIRGARALVLVFSSRANAAAHVLREVTAAAKAELPVLPLRIETVEPSDELGFVLGQVAWEDAGSPPLEPHLAHLGDRLRDLLERHGGGGAPAAAPSPAPGSAGSAVAGRAQVRSALGWHLLRTGKPAEASAVLSEAVALAGEAGDRALQASASGHYALALAALGRKQESMEICERSLALFQEIGERRGMASALGSIANLLQAQGEYVEAAERHARVLELFQELGDRRREAVAHGNVGTSAFALGRYERALTHHERSLDLSREIGYRTGEATALVNLGHLHALLGRFDAGQEALEAAAHLSREVHSPVHEGYALHGMGAVAALAGDLGRARQRYQDALAFRRSLGDRGTLAFTLVALGGVLVSQGEADEAAPLLGEGLTLAQGAVPVATVLGGAHRALLPGGDAAAAVRDFTAHRYRLEAHERLEAAFLLWKATRDASLLAEARRVLDNLVANAPAAARPAMVEAVRLHREVMAASGQPVP